MVTVYEHPLSPYAQKVKIALTEAMAFDRGASNVAETVAQGLFKREYRDHRLQWMVKSGGIDTVV